MSKHSAYRDVLIVSWGGGGNLPPLLAAGKLLAAREHRVCVLASAATRQPAVDAGFEVASYRRARDPNMDTAFEQQAAQLMATAAGPELALDVRDIVAELRPELMIADCMLPAGIAAGESTGTPTASLVHFPYGLARTQMLRGAGAWTTDRAQLNITRCGLGLEPILTLGPAVSVDAIRLPSNIEAIPYADHDQLLPRCAAVITHGGLAKPRPGQRSSKRCAPMPT
jgi:UDP:flavonoid glycosyltransferase YjiC (YdhE family)